MVKAGLPGLAALPPKPSGRGRRAASGYHIRDRRFCRSHSWI